MKLPVSLIAAALLTACAGWYAEISVIGGESEHDRPQGTSFTTAALVGTVGHNFGQKAYQTDILSAMKRAENRADRMEYLALESADREEHIEDLTEANLRLHAPGASFASVWADVQDAAEEDGAEEDIDLSDFTEKPGTLIEASIFVLWIAGLCAILWTLKAVGLLNRILPNNKNRKDKEPE